MSQTLFQLTRKQAMNDIDPKVKAAIDQAYDVFAGTKDGMQALDYLVEVLKVGPTAAPLESQVLVKLVVEVDTSQIDAAREKVDRLREALASAKTADLTSMLADLRSMRTDLALTRDSISTLSAMVLR